ncbi:LOW QUALITY PROTEIN: hypothetical protein TorRG33x02_128200, partial [Trema orientale]
CKTTRPNDSAEAESVFRQDPVVSFGVPLVVAVLKVNELDFDFRVRKQPN